jgi:hypothetical protein
MSRLVRPPPPELISPGDSRTSAPGLLFEDGLLFGSAIGVQLQPPLCREPIFADGLCLCDIGQEFLLECVSHNAEFKPCPEFRIVGLQPVPSHGGIPRGVFKRALALAHLDCPPRVQAPPICFPARAQPSRSSPGFRCVSCCSAIRRRLSPQTRSSRSMTYGAEPVCELKRDQPDNRQLVQVDVVHSGHDLQKVMLPGPILARQRSSLPGSCVSAIATGLRVQARYLEGWRRSPPGTETP